MRPDTACAYRGKDSEAIEHIYVCRECQGIRPARNGARNVHLPDALVLTIDGNVNWFGVETSKKQLILVEKNLRRVHYTAVTTIFSGGRRVPSH